ncbi:unnamed protein product, partial [Adineta steineri]
ISWFKKVDLSDNPVRRWMKQGTNSSTFVCTLFKTGDRCCRNKAWQSIECHMNNKKYRDSIKLFKENTTFTARTESTLSMITVAALSPKNISFLDQVIRAETLLPTNAVQ